MSDTPQSTWAQVDPKTYIGRTSSVETPKLPQGVYEVGFTVQGDPVLTRIRPEFEFPFKVYGTHETIVSRVLTKWKLNGSGNLGVLFNGLKGSGKSVTMQVVANKFIDAGLPVILIKKPLALDKVLESVKQDCVVVFDEFEKTHSDDDDQKELLSTLDGLSRSVHRRCFLFTTNRTTIDTNFLNRPGRIHYKFEFNNLDPDVIEALIDDLIPKENESLKEEVRAFIKTRESCSMDVIKSAITEALQFNESPMEFESFFNSSREVIHGYSLEIVDAVTGEKVVSKSSIEVDSDSDVSAEQLTMVLAGSQSAYKEIFETKEALSLDLGYYPDFRIDLHDFVDGVFLASVQVLAEHTRFRSLIKSGFITRDTLILLDKPDEKEEYLVSRGDTEDTIDREFLEKLRFEQRSCSGSEYGTKIPRMFFVRLSPLKPSPMHKFSSFAEAFKDSRKA